jgi:membrane-associated protease RseP (regulator of RpoE activity)
MLRRYLLCALLLAFLLSLAASAQPAVSTSDRDDNWSLSFSSDEGSAGTAYLGVDIADVSAERLAELKLKEEHGAEVTMVDQDAPAGKAGLHERDVIVSVNGTAIESAAQLRRMIKETPAGRVVALGISRDGQAITIKVQLADRHKSMSWDPKLPKLPKMPEIPEMPTMPDFDIPVSVVIVHSSLRSGLMVENITSQLGEFFGVKEGKGVLVRSVEKGSRGEKAGFRAGDVVVRVNNQPVHDTSDFTHALRSTSGTSAAVTVMRERREQNLTLTLPEKKDSGALMEDSLEIPEVTAQMQEAINMAGDQLARVGPLVEQALQGTGCTEQREQEVRDREQQMRDRQEEMRDRLQERQRELEERQEEMREQQQEREEEMREQQQEMQDDQQERQEQIQERQQELRERMQERQLRMSRDRSGAWAEI